MPGGPSAGARCRPSTWWSEIGESVDEVRAESRSESLRSGDGDRHRHGSSCTGGGPTVAGGKVALRGLLGGVLLWLGISLGGALTDPSLGSSVGARFAEWARGHGAASIVNWVGERVVQPPPAEGRRARSRPARSARPTATPADGGQPAPPTCRRRHRSGRSPARPSPARASGRRPAAWSAGSRPSTRPPCGPTPSTPATSSGSPGWTPSSCSATLYSGSQIPGGGPYPDTAPIQPAAAKSLVAAFNAGFLMSAANGGYYTDGQDGRAAAHRCGLLRRLPERLGDRRAVGPGRHHDARRRLRPPEPRPAGRQRPAGPRSRTPPTRPSGGPPSATRSTCGAPASG